jgi:hypothetical protein
VRLLKCKLTLAIVLVSLISTVSTARAAGASAAVSGFAKLQSLAGDWEGKDDSGNTVRTDFKLVVSNTAVLETLSMSGMEEMLTLYSVDGDGIALVHYCPTNNQPRMRAIPKDGQIKELEFEFQSAANLPDAASGHEHKLLIELQDKDHITEHWTWRKNGKDSVSVFHFVRKNGG